jgi:eukaryotic-like serine/threonine-protein kinase
MTQYHKKNYLINKDNMKLKILPKLIIFSSLLFLLAGCTNAGAASSWPGFSLSEDIAFISNGSQVHAVDMENGSQLWKYPAEGDRNQLFYAAPTVNNGLVVVGDYSGSLTALDESNGTFKWEFSSATDKFVGSVLISDGIVYAPNSDHYLYAIDSDGDLIWKAKTNGPNWTAPVAGEDFIYFASMDHNFYAVPKNVNLNSLVTADDGSKTLLENMNWKIDLGMAVTADPVIVDGVAFVATIEGNLYAIDISSKKILWNFNNDGNLGAVWGTPVVTENGVFIADTNGDVFAVDQNNGSPLWATPLSVGGKIIGRGAAFEDGVVFASDEGKIFSINSEKETKTITTFETPLVTGFSVVGDQIIFAPNNESSLLSAHDKNGFEVWSFLPSK